jgi:GxxExxY protein
MDANQLTDIIIESAIKIHQAAGPGLFESVYEEILSFELNRRGIEVKRQFPIPVVYDGIQMGIGFRADLLVEDTVIVEIKSVESLARVHFKQVLTYLKLSEIKIGLLINFNEEILIKGLRRVVNDF